ncbi:hypothetical protein BO79DRAFT_235398 [Aspergillus costaricaensis CBS 115574]|uniref:Uncharacterized protein n=1 Tax=Aspergillus costaricaensis CBS 115574 TaxID=1448317 RepID=A0ACD1IQQ9_9EURO|nr:hypothetical protein BO79DRAFT_235398 [Aspergillus costaricaensis CBS 115574]RAK92842.1 hypothetical protein BO79DRAFT_235398 [Aspergillus costaricaensis CBS 115574]
MKCSADPSGCLSVQTPASTGSETFPELPGFARRRFFRSSRGQPRPARPYPEKTPGSLYRSDQKASGGKAGSSSESERSDRLRRLSSAN